MDRNAFIPRILEYSPTEFSTGAALSPEIQVRFSLAMAIGDLAETEANVQLNQYVSLANRVTDVYSAVEVITGSFYSTVTETLTFIPSEDLSPGEVYTVTILAGFPASSGRELTDDLSWTFTTAETDVNQVTLTSPADNVELIDSPTFVWQAVTGCTYELQLSESTQFLDPTSVSTTGTSTTQTLTTDTVWYWRVRAVSGSIYGVWSETRAVRLRSQASTTSIFGNFSLVSMYPPDGASNLGSWPSSITLTFSSPPSAVAGVVITAVDTETGVAGTAPTISGAVSGSTLVYSVTGVDGASIGGNIRYTVEVSGVTSAGGVSLSNPTSFSFTGPYTPIYSSSFSLRGAYGRFLKRYTEDEINYQLHRASIRCNRLNPASSNATTLDLLRVVPATVSYDMVAYTEAYAALSLIQAYWYELLEEAGRSDRVDAVSSSVDAGLLREVEKLVGDLQKKVTQLEAIVRGGGPNLGVGVKSSAWDAASLYDDTSIANLGRAKF